MAGGAPASTARSSTPAGMPNSAVQCFPPSELDQTAPSASANTSPAPPEITRWILAGWGNSLSDQFAPPSSLTSNASGVTAYSRLRLLRSMATARTSTAQTAAFFYQV